MSKRDDDAPSMAEKLIGGVLGGAAQLLHLRMLAKTCTHTNPPMVQLGDCRWCPKCGGIEMHGEWHAAAWVDVFDPP